MPASLKRTFAAAVVALVCYLSAAGALALTGFHDHAIAADLIVVPGNTVRADGTLSERLKSRLDVAVGLFRAGLSPAIFVSGGVGHEGRDETAAMAAYLGANGVPVAAVVRDPLGADTAATARNAAKYLRAHRLTSAIVATQYFHVARTTLALERNGVVVKGTAHAHYHEGRDVYSLAREVVAYVAYATTLWPASSTLDGVQGQ